MMPGPTRTVAASGPISQVAKPSPISASTLSVTAWPERLGPGAAEGHRAAVGACCLQQRLHLFLGFDDGDDFRNQAIEAGIRAIGKKAQIVGDDLALRQDTGQRLDQRAQGFLSLSRSR